MTVRLLLVLLCLAFVACDGEADDDDTTPADDDDATEADDDDTTPADDDDTTAADDDDDTTPPEPPLALIDVTCDDVEFDVYVRPVGLPAWDETVLGDVIRCAPDTSLNVLAVADLLEGVGVEDLDPWSGVRAYTLAYRTTRWEGQEGIGTARLYLPDTLVQGGPRPVVVVRHGPHGADDACAPSKVDVGPFDALALAWVGRGYAVIAPDLAGLGNEGFPGFGQTADTAHSVLDAARAVVEAVTPGSVTDEVIVMGLDEGGAGALGAQALAADYLGRPLLAAVAAAPAWRVDDDDLVEAFTRPSDTYFTGDAATRIALRMYTDGGLFNGQYGETSYFHPYVAELITSHILTECYDVLLGTVQFEAIYYSEAFEENFAYTAGQCLTGGAGCAPPGEGFIDRILADRVPMDPAGGPILVVQGMLDTEITPDATACVVESITADGATVQACTLDSAGHDDTLVGLAAFILQWTEAAAVGDPLPECAQAELPVCS